MKKIIKKSCAIALLAVAGTSVAGSFTFIEPTHVYAEGIHESNPALSPAIKITGYNKKVNIGSEFTVPTAEIVGGGTLEKVVVTHNGREVSSNNTAGSKFIVNGIGEYVITYTFDKEGTKYSASTSFRGENIICSLEDVTKKLPKVVPASFVGENDKLVLPIPELVDEEGEKIEGAVVSAIVKSANNQTLPVGADGVIDFTLAKVDGKLKDGNYTIKYVAKIGDTQVAQSTTNYSFNVSKTYEFDVANFKYSFDSQIKTWELGEEKELPGVKATHVIEKDNIEDINVSYTIKKVLFQEKNKETKENVTETVMTGTKFKPNKEGKYTFTYEVKDYLGHVSTFENNLVLEVEDKIKPEIKIVEAYETTAEEHTDAFYKLPTKSLAEDIVVMPMWAEDLGTTKFDEFSKLDITIINLTDSSRPTVFSTSNKIGDTDKTAPVNKELVFNKTNIVIDEATQFDTGVNLVAGNKYRITYTAKDKAGKEASKEYTLEVVSELTYKTPTLEWNEVIPASIEKGETLTFTAPKYKDEIEDNNSLYKVVEYSFDNGVTWTKIEAKDGKYEVKVPDDTVAANLKVRATASNNGKADNAEYADSDYRHTHVTGKLEETITIANILDVEIPNITEIEQINDEEFKQGDEIALPTMKVTDDVIGYVSIDVECYHLGENDKNTKISVFDIVTYADTTTKYLAGAKITAGLKGDYKVIYTVTDAKNNVVVQTYKFNVKENNSLTENGFTNLPTEINDGKVELGEKITLTTPKIVMPEASSATWYVKQLSGPSDAIKGYGEQYYFEPTKVGTYKLQYVGKIDMSDEIKSKEYTVIVEDTTNPEYYIDVNIPQQLEKDAEYTIPVFSADDGKGSGINEEKSYVRLSCNSQTYNSISLKDLSSKTPEELNETLTFKMKYQEEYTLTYYIEDNEGNSITKTFKIAVGDTELPELKLEEDVIKQNNKTITTTASKGKINVDLSKIKVSDNVSDLKKEDVVVTLKNKDLNKVVDAQATEGDGKYIWNIENAGNYEMTFKVTDAAGHVQTVTKTFTVDAKDNNGSNKTQVLGTILVVVAVLVLAGVIVYFIVSKKKSDKLYKEN